MKDSLTEDTRKEAPWQMIFADYGPGDVRKGEKRALRWRWNWSSGGSLGEERTVSVKRRDRVHVPEWNTIIKMGSAQLPQVTEIKFLGSTLQSDGDVNAEVNKKLGWNSWRKMSRVLCDKRIYTTPL